MPFVAVRLPRWFSERYPHAAANLRLNSERLTTPFDLHETLLDVVDMERSRNMTEGRTRAYSLFKDIPDDRTCADADIEPHWLAYSLFEPHLLACSSFEPHWLACSSVCFMSQFTVHDV